MHQADHAGRARHVALHVLHAGGRLDRNAAGVEAHALADEGERRGALLAAVPAHDDDAALTRRALADAEQRTHAELAQRPHVEHLDADAELAQRGRAARQFHRIEDVRRLVDEVAREHHAFGKRLARTPRLARGRNVGDAKRDARLGRRVLAFLALGLVAIERIGPQARAERDVGRSGGLERAVGKFEHDGRRARRGRNATHRDAAELDEIVRLAIGRLAGADDDQPRNAERRRRHDVERRSALAGELLGLGDARDQFGRGTERRAGLWPKPQVAGREYHQDTARRGCDRRKGEFRGVGH